MEQVKLIDRDHDEYLREVFSQDLPESFTIKDRATSNNKLQKNPIAHAEDRIKNMIKSTEQNKKPKEEHLAMQLIEVRQNLMQE